MCAKQAKNLRFYIPILKKRKKTSLWMWTLVKNRVIGCKIFVKKGIMVINRQMIPIFLLLCMSGRPHKNCVWAVGCPLLIGCTFEEIFFKVHFGALHTSTETGFTGYGRPLRIPCSLMWAPHCTQTTRIALLDWIPRTVKPAAQHTAQIQIDPV